MHLAGVIVVNVKYLVRVREVYNSYQPHTAKYFAKTTMQCMIDSVVTTIYVD